MEKFWRGVKGFLEFDSWMPAPGMNFRMFCI